MSSFTVCLLGGTGFVGRTLAAQLVAQGVYVKILTRRPARHRSLLVLPSLRLVAADVHDPKTLAREFSGCDAVVNLVGILNERGHRGRGFQQAHVQLAQQVLSACQQSGVPRLLHMGALNAAVDAPSHYLRSKGRAASLLLEAGASPQVTVFEPSVIFGADDSFFKRFAALLRRVPVLPLACARSKLAPVYVGDVAAAFTASLQRHASFGRRLQLCGPQVYTLGQLVRYTARVMQRKRLIFGLPRPLAWLQAILMEWLPGKPFSLDNYHSLLRDSVCTENGFAVLGLVPQALESIVPNYLGPHSG